MARDSALAFPTVVMPAMALRLFALGLASLIASGCGSGQAGPRDPDGELAGPGTEPTDVLFGQGDEDSTEGQFLISIKRDFADKFAASLLRQAEEIQPARDEVLAAAGSSSAQEALGASPDEPLWWYAQFDGVRIPYAVTSDAIEYYAGVISKFRKGDFSASAGVAMQKAALTYEAKVTHSDSMAVEGQTFQDVWVVEMTLGWSQWCGAECALGFFKQRVVVFDASGGVLAIFHDGKTQYVVS